MCGVWCFLMFDVFRRDKMFQCDSLIWPIKFLISPSCHFVTVMIKWTTAWWPAGDSPLRCVLTWCDLIPYDLNGIFYIFFNIYLQHNQSVLSPMLYFALDIDVSPFKYVSVALRSQPFSTILKQQREKPHHRGWRLGGGFFLHFPPQTFYRIKPTTPPGDNNIFWHPEPPPHPLSALIRPLHI